jgi:hypothetical protein
MAHKKFLKRFRGLRDGFVVFAIEKVLADLLPLRGLKTKKRKIELFNTGIRSPVLSSHDLIKNGLN